MRVPQKVQVSGIVLDARAFIDDTQVGHTILGRILAVERVNAPISKLRSTHLIGGTPNDSNKDSRVD